MRSIVEINAEKDELRAKGRELIENCKAEERKLDEGEQKNFDEISERLKALDAEIEKAEEESRNIQNINNQNQEEVKMETKKFSLFRAVRSIANGQPLDELSAAVVNESRNEMRAAGLSANGQIVIPSHNKEIRAIVSEANSGNATVPVDVAGIFDEMRAQSVFDKVGATYYNGLVGDMSVPVMTAASVAWSGENGAAADAAAAVSGITLQPKRLTAYLDISKQMLLQEETPQLEANLTQNLIRAIEEKFEQTVFGSAAASASQPAGMLNGITPETLTTAATLFGLEKDCEEAGAYNLKYVAAPSAKAKIRSLSMNKSTRNVYENGDVDGTPLYATANLAANNVIVGDWKYLCIGTWGNVSVTVDPYTQAGAGCVRLVIDSWVDAKVANSAAFAFGKF